MKNLTMLLSIVLISSCSSLSGLGQSNSFISLSDIEEIKLGEATRTDIERRFGRPESEISISNNEYALIFCRKVKNKCWQRASFTLQKKSNIVLASMWLPNSTDELKDISFAKARFPKAKFQYKEKGWVGHEYSDDAAFSDESLGVAIDIRRTSQKVDAISFILPQEKRTPATSR